MKNLDKLNLQSLGDIDASQITKALSENQNIIIKTVLVIGTLVLAAVMFNDYHHKDMGVHSRMLQVQMKINAIKARETAIQELKDFKSSLAKQLNEIELISLISSYSKLCHVTISSLSPAGNKDMGLYDVTKVNFNLSSDNFKDMMLFIRKIEESEFPLRVDSWSGHEDDSGRITFSIEIDIVVVHS